MIVHPNYGLETGDSADIALLELEVKAKLCAGIQWACLPKTTNVGYNLTHNDKYLSTDSVPCIIQSIIK